MPYFKATIELLVEADDDTEAADAISEGMRPMLKTFEPLSSWIDWRYSDCSIMPFQHSGEGFEYASDDIHNKRRDRIAANVEARCIIEGRPHEEQTIKDAVGNTYIEGIDDKAWIADALDRLGVAA